MISYYFSLWGKKFLRTWTWCALLCTSLFLLSSQNSYGQYCTASSGSSSWEYLSNVTFGTINNSTGASGYSDFTTTSATVIAGQTISFSASIGGAYSSDQVLVWIDFNGDLDFNDAGEQVYVSTQGVGPHSSTITIPSTASAGNTRMRVRLHDTSFGPNTTPCGTSSYGEVEDYGITILVPQTVTIGTGTLSSYFYGPLYRSSASSSFDYSVYDYLFTATELANAGVGPGSIILGIGYNKTSAFQITTTATGNAYFDTYMNNTSASSLSNTTWGAIQSSFTAVANDTFNAVNNLPATTGWMNINLDAPFAYTGGGLEIAHYWNISGVSGSPTTGVLNFQYGSVPGTSLGYAGSANATSTTTVGTGTYGGTNRANIQITYVSQGCNGVPTAGNTISSEVASCIASPITLSLSTPPAGSGITFDWQLSTDGINYSSVTAGNGNSTLSTLNTVPTYYQCVVTCTNSSQTVTSTPVFVGVNSFLSCYCIPNPSNGGTGDNVVEIGLGTYVNNTSTAGNPKYTYFTADTIQATIGLSYPAYITMGTDGNQYSKAWIDYNQDGAFSASEVITTGNTNAGASGTNSFSFTIPLTAQSGLTRIRFRGGDDGAIADGNACNDGSWGEVEDYLINITSPPAEDAGLVAFSSPVSPLTAGFSPVSVEVANAGLNALSTASINWEVNGIPQIPLSFNAGSSPIAFGATQSNVALGGYNFIGGSYVVKAWISNPNGQSDPNALNDTIQATFCLPFNGNYTVGTNGSDFQTLQSAIDAMQYCGIDGPVVLDVEANLSEQVEIGEILNASSTNTLTINGHGYELSATPSLANPRILTLNGTDYLTVDSLDITTLSTTYGRGIWMTNDCNYINIKNLTVDVSLPTFPSSTYCQGIHAAGSLTTWTTQGNSVNHLLVDNVEIIGGYNGFGVYGSLSAKQQDIKVLNSTVRDYYVYGTYIVYVDDLTIYNSDFNRKNRSDISTFYGIYCSSGRKVDLQDNKVHDSNTGSSTNTSNYGIYLSSTNGTASDMNKIYNNRIYNLNTGASSLKYAMYLISSAYSEAYHNTIDIGNPAGTGTCYGYYSSGAGNVLKNNIISITQPAGTRYGIYASNTTLVSNHNVVSVAAGGNFGYLSGVRATLTAWQATTNDSNSVEAAPIFTDVVNGDLTPTNILADNIGDYLGIPYDAIGTPRPATPDAGALEFTGVPADIMVTEILTPPTAPCFYANDSAYVVIKNNSALPIDFSQNNFIVNWSVTGAATSSGADTITAGIIPGLGLDTVTIHDVNLGAQGTYNISIALASTWDGVSTNDNYTDAITIDNLSVNGPLTVSNQFATPLIQSFSDFYLPGLPAVTADVTWSSWASENKITITDSQGNVVFTYCDPTNCFNGNSGSAHSASGLSVGCLAAGTYTYVTEDSYLNFWDGSGDNVTLYQGSNVVAVITHPGGASTTGTFTIANTSCTASSLAPGASVSWTDVQTSTQVSTSPEFTAGPYTLSGAYQYAVALVTPCGTTLTDTVTVNVTVPPLYDAKITAAGPSVYTITPASQTGYDSLVATIQSSGINAVTNASVTFNGPGTATSTVIAAAGLTFGQSATATKQLNAPLATGTYPLQVVSSIVEADGDGTNDTLTYDYQVSDSLLARDLGAGFFGIGFNGATGELGMMMDVFAQDTLTGVQFYLTNPTVGDNCKFNLYNWDDATKSPTTKIGSSPIVTISGGAQWYTVNFNCSYILTPGKYFFAVEQLDLNNLNFGYSYDNGRDSIAAYRSGAAWTAFETGGFGGALLAVRGVFGDITGFPPGSPVVTSNDAVYCENSTATSLSATGLTNSTINWYTDNTFTNYVGSGSVVPQTATASNTYYYATQAIGTCESEQYDSVNVNVIAPIAISSTVINDETACNAGDGSIVVNYPTSGSQYSINGGSTYSTATGATSFTYSALASGNYTIMIIDSISGCDVTSTVLSVGAPGQPAAPVAANDTTYCANETFAALTATATGTVNWYSDANLNTSLGSGTIAPTTTLGTTTYYVTQTVSSCESNADMVTVTVNAVPTAPTLAGNVAYCDNATPMQLAATGTDITWYNAATLLSADSVGIGAMYTPASTLGVTTYYATQTVSGCESPAATATATINAAPAAPAVSADQTLCQGATIAPFTATGNGGTYNWYTNATLTNMVGTGASFTPTVTLAGYYTYYAVEVDGTTQCQGPAGITHLTLNTSPANPILPNDVAYCDGATIANLVPGNVPGATTNWYSNNTLTTSLGTGTITPASTVGTTVYYATLSNGACSSPYDSVVVAINAIPAAPTVSSATAICSGATTPTLTATGSNVNWYTSNALTGAIATTNNLTPATAVGNYSYFATQTVNNCTSAYDSVLYTVNSLPTFTWDTTTVSTCGATNGGAEFLTTTGNLPFTYSINGGNTFSPSTAFTNLPAGGYSLVVQDVNGCQSLAASASIDNPGAPAAPVVAGGATYCDGATITDLSATAITGTIAWYSSASLLSADSVGAGATFTPSSAVGTHTYYAAEIDNGCKSSGSMVSVTVNAIPATPVAAGGNNYCAGSTLTALTVTGAGGTYNWYSNAGLTTAAGTGASINPTNTLGSKTYYVTETANGCTSAAAATTVQISPIPPQPTAANAAYCIDATPYTLTASTATAGVLNWYDDMALANMVGTSGSITAPATTAGSYNYYVQVDLNGCKGAAKLVNLQVNALPTPMLGADQAICSGFTSNLDPGAGYASYSWSTGSSNPTITVSADNDYAVTVVDGNGCVNADTMHLTINALPVPALGNDLSICDGNTQTFTPGTFASYLWSDNSTNSTLDATTAGSYVVTVTDGNGCQKSDTVNLGIYALPSAALTGPTEVCSGFTASIDAPSGLTYAWSDGSTSQGIVKGTGGTYTVTVTDGNACNNSSSITLTINDNPVVATTGSDVLCNGGSTGNTSVSVSTATTANYTYMWSNAVTTAANNGVAIGTYVVTVTDDNGCKDTADYTINEPTALTNSLTKVDASCGVNDGKAFVTAAGGTPNYTYLWSNAGVNDSIVNLGSGNYSVTITDGNGCTSIGNIVINNTSAPILAPTVTDASCATYTDGALAANGSNGTGTLNYEWLENAGGTIIATTETVSNVGEGTYTVIVTDSIGCINSVNNVVVSANNPLPVVNLGNDVAICSGTSTNLIAPVGNPAYAWSSGGTNQVESVSAAGTYTVTVTDANNCSNSDEIVVTVNALPAINLGNDTSICAGNSITFNATAAMTTYAWTDASTGSSITASNAGYYAVTITDANGCVNSDAINLGIYSLPTVSIADAAICAGDVYTFNAPAGLSYAWSTAESTQSISNGTAGTYSVTVTDANNCSNSDGATLTVNALPVVNLGNDVAVCSGATATLNAGTGFVSYSWSDGSSNQAVFATTAGTYVVTVTDLNGCSNNDDIVVTVNALPVVNLGNDTSICAGNSLALVATPGMTTYQWTTGASTANISATNAGFYSVTVTNSNGCSSSDAINLGIYSLPTVSIADAAICSGDNYTFSAPAGLTYAWSTSATTQTISASTAGSYTVTVTNSNGCSASDAAVLTVNALPTVTLGANQAICSGSSTALTPGTGYTSYAWSTSSAAQTISVSTANTYTVTVTDANGCANNASVVVSVNALPVVNLSNTSVCQGNTATFDAGAFSAYAWSTAATSQSITASTAGTYTVTVTDANGCQNSGSATLGIFTLPSATITGPAAVCDGDVASFSAPAGLSYAWSNAGTTQSISATAAGTYSLTVTDGNNCSSSSSVTLAINALPVFNLGNDTAACAGTPIFVLGPLGNASYSWSNGESTPFVSITTSGNYVLTVVDLNGCQASDAIDVTINALPVVDLGADSTFCAGTTLTLDAGAGFANYMWSTLESTSTISAGMTNIYSVTVTDGNGCMGGDAITIVVNANPVVDLGADIELCSSQTATLDGGAGFASYTWSNGATTQTLNVDTTTAGTYYVVVTDANGCFGGDSVVVTAVPCLGIDNVVRMVDVKMYPNPTNGELNIAIDGIEGQDAVITIMDLTGKVIESSNINVTSNQVYTYNLSGKASGLYLVRITSGNMNVVKRVTLAQ